ncbi:MAG: hypothetical protein U0271_26925 [Polyangiaceae bacterium]
MSERSILAVELCMRLDPAIQNYLRQLITTGTEKLNFHQKWWLYDQVRRTLVSQRALWVKGCWDFFDNDTKARSDFNMWVQGMLTEEGARPTPSGQPDPYRGDARYMTFTAACMMVKMTPSERQIAAQCDIPESQLWTAASFERVLNSFAYLNFASVEGSTLYLIPRDTEYGLTDEDLRHPKFEYLRPIL